MWIPHTTICHSDLGLTITKQQHLNSDQHQLSAGDMVAIEAKYHNKCLVSLYNHVRAVQRADKQYRNTADVISAVVLAELVTYIEESEEDTAPVFKLANLNKLYTNRMEQLGVEVDQRVHTTRLKKRTLAHFPDLPEHRREEMSFWCSKMTLAVH